MAAKDRLLKDSKPDYIKKYEKISKYLKTLDLRPSTLDLENNFVVFIDLCE